MGDLRRSTACSPPSRGISLLRRLLRRREGGGSPAPTCTYGRVGWRSRRRCLGGGGAGGGCFGVGAAFSGGGVPRGSSSSRSTCWCSTPGAVLEFLSFPSDLWWRRIRWLEFRSGRRRRFLPATETKMAAARWSSWRGRALAVLVHRQKFRRGAADGLCGFSQGRRCSQAVVRGWPAVFVLDAGGAADVGSGSVPLRIVLCFLFVLCTVYVVLC